jgi:acetyl-CoA carboxylase alpha subunit
MAALEGALSQNQAAQETAVKAVREQEQRLKMIERLSVAAEVQERREEERKALEDWLDTVRQASEKLHGPP